MLMKNNNSRAECRDINWHSSAFGRVHNSDFGVLEAGRDETVFKITFPLDLSFKIYTNPQ